MLFRSISDKVGFKYHEQRKTQFIDYKGHSDARTQMRLPARDEPYLFYNRENTNSHFNNYIKQETQEFFATIFDISEPYKNNELLKKVLFYALNNNDIYGLMPLLEKSAQKVKRTEEFATLVEVNRQFIKELNQGNIDFDCLNEGAYANSVNNKGKSALHIAVEQNNKDTMKRLNAYSINLSIQDDNGYTAPHLVGADIETLKIILTGYPKEKVLEVLMIKNNIGYTALDRVSASSAGLKILLERCPTESMSNIFFTYKILDIACDSLKYLKVLLEFFQPEKIVGALKLHHLYEYLSDENLALLESHKNEAVLVKETIEKEKEVVSVPPEKKEAFPVTPKMEDSALVAPAKETSGVSIREEKWEKILSSLRDKIADFELRKRRAQQANSSGYNELNKAYNAANQLMEQLVSERETYNKHKPSHESFEQFQTNCFGHVKEARKTLDKHRGWSEFLTQLVLAITTLGVGTLINGLYNLANNNSFWSISSTKSSKILDTLEQDIKADEPKLR